MLGTATLSFARSSQLTYTAQKLYGAKLESTAYKNLLPIRTKSVITVESILRAKAAPYMNKVGYNSGAFYFERKLLPIRTKSVISVGRFTSSESSSVKWRLGYISPVKHTETSSLYQLGNSVACQLI